MWDEKVNLCSDTGISAKKQIGAMLKDKFFFCYPNLQGRFSFDAGFKRYCRLLCVSSLSSLFSCCFVSASISAAILDILFFSHETTGINMKYIFPTSAWFLYLGEKAYFRWVKRLRGKGKKNGLMENCSRNIEGGDMERMTGSKNPSA